MTYWAGRAACGNEDRATASKVGVRHGKLVILRVKAGDMHLAGHAFYLSANGVWVVESVGVEWLEIP